MKFILVVFTMLMLTSVIAEDIRYCEGQPERLADGTIKRSSAVIAEFKADHPCPITKKSTGPCPGWSVDHVIPLAVGGCDLPFNLQWLPVEIKSCAGKFCKDRWERKIYNRKEL